MYKIRSLNGWHDGRTFESLAAAVAYANKYSSDGTTVDIIYPNDCKTFRHVYTGSGSHGGAAYRGTYHND